MTHMSDIDYLPSYEQMMHYRQGGIMKDMNYCENRINERIETYKSKWIESQMILNAVDMALDGEHEQITDFEASFPIVRKAMDMWVENEH